MAGTRIEYEVVDREVMEMLARQAEPPGSDIMNRIGEHLQASTEDRFKTQTAPDGTPWQPLKARYAKRKKYNADKILTLRGYLRGGIRHQVTGDTSVEVGANLAYAAIHQLGGTIDMPARQATVRFKTQAGRKLFAKRGAKGATERQASIGKHQVNMPARPYLGISAADDQEIREIILDWVVGRAGG
jgi:phage virion morphogenesis protein